MTNKTKLLEIKNLHRHFPIKKGFLEQITLENGKVTRKVEKVHAINGVDLTINKGDALCVVGESGCGKSTVARVVMNLISPTEGEIIYDGTRIDNLKSKTLLPFRKRMQMIFQNPYASLNPRMTILDTLMEPIKFHYPKKTEQERRTILDDTMESVGIDPSWVVRYPHEFSGGQRQRISIARALSTDPEFIVADEPISALDVSIQAQVLNLLMKAREERQLTFLFITHDLSVVEQFGSHVAVMYLGTICEYTTTKSLFDKPLHPYTQALISAIPKLEEDNRPHVKLHGEVPTPVNLPTGCVFHTRCPFANDRCKTETPAKQEAEPGHFVACHAVDEDRI